jgi:hypothetical protein
VDTMTAYGSDLRARVTIGMARSAAVANTRHAWLSATTTDGRNYRSALYCPYHRDDWTSDPQPHGEPIRCACGCTVDYGPTP